MIVHHPSDDLLRKFIEGNLDAALSIVVSAHTESCLQCQEFVGSFGESVAEKIFGLAKIPYLESDTSGRDEIEKAWIKVSFNLKAPVSVERDYDRPITIDGANFVLPRSLSKFSSSPLKWMPFGRGGKICKLGHENKKSLFLIYLSSAEEVPLHSHEGTEHSYVISGSFAADGTTYNTGDFSVSTPDVLHAPRAGIEDGCLLLSSVENRLNFLQGWLKPLNGFLWWVLNLRVRWM